MDELMSLKKEISDLRKELEKMNQSFDKVMTHLLPNEFNNEQGVIAQVNNHENRIKDLELENQIQKKLHEDRDKKQNNLFKWVAFILTAIELINIFLQFKK